MKLFLYLALCSCAVPALAQPQPVQSQKEQYTQATPQQAIDDSVRDFLKAVNENSFYQAQSYVESARIGYFGAQIWLRDFGKPLELNDLSIEPLQLEAEHARVAVTYVFNAPGVPVKHREVLELKRGPATHNPKTRIKSYIWQIVPPAKHLAAPQDNTVRDFDWFSYLSWKLAQKPLTPADYDSAQSLSNLKQLGLASAQFSQDYDSIASAPEYLEEALFPYLKDRSVFCVPNSYERYAFNNNLTERFIDINFGFPVAPPVNAVAQPEKVVLFYEGRDEKLNFRYDGKAAVSFADGHVALVSPDEAKNLRWIP